MKLAGIFVCSLLTLALAIHADDTTDARDTRPPTRIPVSGVLQTVTGEPRQGEVTLILSIYADRDSAEPLWAEEQTVVLREDGRYDVALGATSEEGLASELFAANGARWVGIAEKGDLEQPRFMLVSVPYATKALDAEAVGGRRVKDFVLAEELEEKVASVLARPGPVDASQDVVASQSVRKAVDGVRSFRLELEPRSEADAAVAAAGRFTNEATTGEMYGIHAHVHSTSSGGTYKGPTGVFGEVTPTNAGGFSAGVRGVNRGTGGSGIGVVGVQNGSGWGVYGATPSGIGVNGYSNTGIGVFGTSAGPGAGVFASHTGDVTTGPALQIEGGIKVSGTHRAAFVHTISETARTSTIDHPLVNGRPDAILFVTERAVRKTNPISGFPELLCCSVTQVGVVYAYSFLPGPGQWVLVANGSETFEQGTQFNILVINQ